MTTTNRLAFHPVFSSPIAQLIRLWVEPYDLYKSPCLKANAAAPEKFLHIRAIASDVLPQVMGQLENQGRTLSETEVLVWGYGTILVLPYVFLHLGFPVAGVEYGGKDTADQAGNMFDKLEKLFSERLIFNRFPVLNSFKRFSHLTTDQPVYDLAFIINPHPGLWTTETGLEQQMVEWLRWLKPGALAFLQIDGDYNDPKAIASHIFQRILQGQEFELIGVRLYAGTDAPFPSFYKNYTNCGNVVLTLKKR
jgi:hypothetical protein